MGQLHSTAKKAKEDKAERFMEQMEKRIQNMEGWIQRLGDKIDRWLKKEGYAKSTIETRYKLLRILSKRGANLHDPESVKDVIAQQKMG